MHARAHVSDFIFTMFPFYSLGNGLCAPMCTNSICLKEYIIIIEKPTVLGQIMSVFTFYIFRLYSSFKEVGQPEFKVTFSFLKLKTRGKDSDFTAQNHVSSTGLPSPDPGVIDFCW